MVKLQSNKVNWNYSCGALHDFSILAPTFILSAAEICSRNLTKPNQSSLPYRYLNLSRHLSLLTLSIFI